MVYIVITTLSDYGLNFFYVECVHMSGRFEDNFWKLGPLLLPRGSWRSYSSIGLGGRSLYLLSHFASPHYVIICVCFFVSMCADGAY